MLATVDDGVGMLIEIWIESVNSTIRVLSSPAIPVKDPKSLMRMLSNHGTSNVKNLFRATQFLQKKAGAQFKVVSSKPKTSRKQELVH